MRQDGSSKPTIEKEVKKRMLKRGQVLAYFANLPKCRVGMEACAGAHDWARKLRELEYVTLAA